MLWGRTTRSALNGCSTQAALLCAERPLMHQTLHCPQPRPKYYQALGSDATLQHGPCVLDAIAGALEGSASVDQRIAPSHTLSEGLAGRRPGIVGPAQPEAFRQTCTVLLHVAIKRDFPVQVWPERFQASLVANMQRTVRCALASPCKGQGSV